MKKNKYCYGWNIYTNYGYGWKWNLPTIEKKPPTHKLRKMHKNTASQVLK